jgi:hypothetical protein
MISRHDITEILLKVALNTINQPGMIIKHSWDAAYLYINSYPLNIRAEATNTNFVNIGLTWPGLKPPMIYSTWDKHANHSFSTITLPTSVVKRLFCALISSALYSLTALDTKK